MGQSINSLSPAGIIKPNAGSTVPTGYLACDGSAVSRTTYAQLFSAVGTTFGVGDGSTTFNVPDLRGRVPMGEGAGSGLTVRTRGQAVGSETHTLAGTNLPAHAHSITHTHAMSVSGSNNASSVSGSTDTQSVAANARTPAGFSASANDSNFMVVSASTGNFNAVMGGSGHSHNVSGTAAAQTWSGSVGNQTFTGSSDNGPGTSAAVNHINPALVVKFVIKF